jgi:protein-L-isoaspartate(D-aspartate) O-methyltransferase
MRSPVARAGIAALFSLVTALPAACARAPDAAAFRERREALVDAIAAGGVRDSATLAALRAVPRHEFVPAEFADLAYLDEPLPIGHGQTISQPGIVAVMTEALRPRPGLRVLEVGTGSGYQAAVLAQAGCRVHSIEIIEALADSARARLRRLGYGSVEVRHGDGYLGWPEAAPFDAIILTAAPERIPPGLVEQLATGGRLVAPVGPEGEEQQLQLLEKDAGGRVRVTRLLAVRFVPMRGRPGP